MLFLFVDNILGRYDLRLPDYVIEQLGLVEALQPILSRLETIMGSPKPQLRTHNVVFVPVGECMFFFLYISYRRTISIHVMQSLVNV